MQSRGKFKQLKKRAREKERKRRAGSVFCISCALRLRGQGISSNKKTREGDEALGGSSTSGKPAVLRKEIIYLRALARGQSFCLNGD